MRVMARVHEWENRDLHVYTRFDLILGVSCVRICARDWRICMLCEFMDFLAAGSIRGRRHT